MSVEGGMFHKGHFKSSTNCKMLRGRFWRLLEVKAVCRRGVVGKIGSEQAKRFTDLSSEIENCFTAFVLQRVVCRLRYFEGRVGFSDER
jgi:hypothetical protein